MWDEQSRILQAVLKSNPEYVNISCTDTRGIVRASARLRTGTDLSVVYLLRAYRTVFENMDLPKETILGITNHVGVKTKRSVWDAIPAQDMSGIIADSGTDGVERFSAFRKLFLPSSEDFYLSLVPGIPESVAREPSQRILRRNLLIMGITILFSIGSRTICSSS
jgi:hypothetical protein